MIFHYIYDLKYLRNIDFVRVNWRRMQAILICFLRERLDSSVVFTLFVICLFGGPKVITHTQSFNNSRNSYQNCSKMLENIDMGQT